MSVTTVKRVINRNVTNYTNTNTKTDPASATVVKRSDRQKCWATERRKDDGVSD